MPASSAECTRISPPCAVTIARAMKSPSPRRRVGPPDLPRASGSKTDAWAAGGMGHGRLQPLPFERPGQVRTGARCDRFADDSGEQLRELRGRYDVINRDVCGGAAGH